MMDIESLLKSKCDGVSHLELLWHQWSFEKELILGALRSVALTFPHYSMHDGSHSSTILLQVERVLGPDRLSMLSATDLWLLLEVAYSHDLGMVLTDESLRDWWLSDEGRQRLVSMQQSEDPDLRAAAKLLASPDGLAGLAAWPFEVKRALTLVVADAMRRGHAERSKRIVDAPDVISLALPRSLLPPRLHSLVGLVGAAHGMTFPETLQLPALQSGMGTDLAHPRFVACMLRLGDLLDLDGGRFCPVMTRVFGTLTAVSAAHARKHAAIRSLCVCSTHVSAEAVCSDYDSFDETERWFSWLRAELLNLAAHWAEIAPVEANGFGAPPTCGSISTRLEGYLTLENGDRPRFEVDRETIIGLVRGAGLYEGPFSCIREVLQNAVDATLLRAWIERRDEIEGWRDSPDAIRNLRRLLKRDYPIAVTFSKIGRPTASEVKWHVEIVDQGIGISRKDIPHIQRVGGTRHNPHRRLVQQQMPEWMRPSGVFGIGLQSVFLFAEAITITTRSMASLEVLHIELRKGKDEGQDAIHVQSAGDQSDLLGPPMKVGTRIEFDLVVPSIPPHISFGPDEREVSKELRDFDGVVDDELPFEVAQARDQVLDMAATGLCAISLDGRYVSDVPEESQASLFDPVSGIEVFLEAGGRRAEFDLHYRGAPTASCLAYEILAGWINVHAGAADGLLCLNREKFTRDGTRDVAARAKAALERLVPTLLDRYRSQEPSSSQLPWLSLFAHLYMTGTKNAGEEWKSISTDWGTLGALADARTVDVIQYDDVETHAGFAGDAAYAPEPSHILIRLKGHGSQWFWDLLMLGRSAAYLGREPVTESPTRSSARAFRFNYRLCAKESRHDPLPDAGLRAALGEIHRGHWGLVGLRHTMPCPATFPHLLLAPNRAPPYSHSIQSVVRARMVCPFCWPSDGIVVPRLAEVVRWTAAHSDSRCGEKAVAQNFLRFIRHADELMSVEWGDNRRYDLRDIEAELRYHFAIQPEV